MGWAYVCMYVYVCVLQRASWDLRYCKRGGDGGRGFIRENKYPKRVTLIIVTVLKMHSHLLLLGRGVLL